MMFSALGKAPTDYCVAQELQPYGKKDSTKSDREQIDCTIHEMRK
jgi:hypothetical protein